MASRDRPEQKAISRAGLSSTLSKNPQLHRLAWMWKMVSSRKISLARSRVSLRRPKSPKVRQRPLLSDQ